MENNWEPRVGQKVVALKDTHSFRKGEEFLILAVTKPCKHFLLDIGIKMPFSTTCHCVHCGYTDFVFEGKPWLAASYLFAPIISAEYPDKTAEIAQQFKEHPDAVDQPVKILETVN